MKNLFKKKSAFELKVEQHAKLLILKQNIKDRMHEKNSAIETKLKKLENKTYLNKTNADRQVAEIDRLLLKIQRELDNEKEYINSINVEKLEVKK